MKAESSFGEILPQKCVQLLQLSRVSLQSFSFYRKYVPLEAVDGPSKRIFLPFWVNPMVACPSQLSSAKSFFPLNIFFFIQAFQLSSSSNLNLSVTFFLFLFISTLFPTKTPGNAASHNLVKQSIMYCILKSEYQSETEEIRRYTGLAIYMDI